MSPDCQGMGITQDMGITRAGRRASAVHLDRKKNETPEAVQSDQGS